MSKALAVILIAGIFIWLGIERGEIGIIFKKAANICLECVGLG